MSKKDPTEKLQIALQIFVLITIILALFFNGKGINFVSEWFTKIFIGMVYSIIAGAIIGTFTGNWFEQEIFRYKIIGIKINIPIVILTFAIKIILI